MTFSTNCIYNCWECSKECTMKKVMSALPEASFNQMLLQALKATAGMNLVAGCSKEEADNFVKENAVAIYIARQKYLETLKKSR